MTNASECSALIASITNLAVARQWDLVARAARRLASAARDCAEATKEASEDPPF